MSGQTHIEENISLLFKSPQKKQLLLRCLTSFVSFLSFSCQSQKVQKNASYCKPNYFCPLFSKLKNFSAHQKENFPFFYIHPTFVPSASAGVYNMGLPTIELSMSDSAVVSFDL